MESKSLVTQDSSSMIYYHYLDENFNNQGFGRVDKEVRAAADTNETRSYTYTYFGSTKNVQDKYCYQTTSFTTLFVTYQYNSLGQLLNATFDGTSVNYNTINCDVIFNGSSSNRGIINGNVAFNGSSYNNSGTINGDTVFNGSSCNRGTVSGNAVFNNASCNRSYITGNAAFNNSSFNLYGTVSGDAVFYDSSRNNFGVINSHALFYGTSHNDSGIINGRALFYDSSYSISAGINCDALFYDSSCNKSGAISGNAIFNNSSRNEGTIYGNATFNDSSWNSDGTINGNAIFNSSSYNNYGIINGDAIFNGSSHNSGGTINGDATFNGSNYNSGGTINGNAAFNGTSYNAGTVNGDVVFNDSSYYYYGTIIGNAKFNTTRYNGTAPSGGLFTIGSGEYWGGIVKGTVYGSDGIAITNYIFNGTSYNTGTINGKVTLNNSSSNRGTINGNAAFNDSSYNLRGIITGNVVFNGSSHNSSGTINGDATFNTIWYNGTVSSGGVFTIGPAKYWSGKISGAAYGSDGVAITSYVFNGSSYNNGGTINGDAMFNDSSYLFTGTINGNAVFNTTWYNGVAPSGGIFTIGSGKFWRGIVNGTVYGSDGIAITSYVFNGSGWNNRGNLNGNVTFNDSSYNNRGTINGNVTFNTTWYSGVAPSGGVFTIGPAKYWSGKISGTVYGSDGRAITRYIFNGTSCNNGTINGNAAFNDSSSNKDTINGDAAFNDSSSNKDTINGDAAFNDASYNDGTINGDTIFSDSGRNSGTINGDAVFNDSAFGWHGTINGNAAFNGSSYNGGTVNGNATFSNSSYTNIDPVDKVTGTVTFTRDVQFQVTQYGWWTDTTKWIFCGTHTWLFAGKNNFGIINGDVVFNGSGCNVGTINGNATFNDSSYNSGGTINGNAAFNTTWYSDLAPSGGIFTIGSGKFWNGMINGTVYGSDGVAIRSYVFNGSSYNSGGTINGNVTFNDSSINNYWGTINGNATFNGSSYNYYSTINGNARFNTTWYSALVPYGGIFTIDSDKYWSGIVNGMVCGSDNTVITSYLFNDKSYNSHGATINGNAAFNDSSCNYGKINGNAAFNDSSINNGIVTGIITSSNYTYYDNGRISSRTLAFPDANGMIYYHYLDEDWQGQGYGRVNEARRQTPLNNEFFYTYTYDSTGRVQIEQAYSARDIVSLVRTYTYKYYNEGYIASVTLSSPDYSGIIYYHYLDEDWQGQGYGRVDCQIRGDSTMLIAGSEVTGFIQDSNLIIVGTIGSDTIKIREDISGITVTSNTGNTVFTGTISKIDIYTFDGDDIINVTSSVLVPVNIYAGSGNDELFANNASGDILAGGPGNNLLVAINGYGDILIGGNGLDSFWCDATDTINNLSTLEISDNAVHQISQFYQPFTVDPANPNYIPLTIAGQNLPDPTDSGTTMNVSTYPLFNDGMVYYDDIEQGPLGDCYFMAGLASLASEEPDIILQSIAPLGDGTYGVRFYKSSVAYYLRIDGDIPASDVDPSTRYADFGTGNDTWTMLLEKAFAFFRYLGQNTYGSIEGGWLDEPFTTLTGQWHSDIATFSNGSGISDASLYNLLQVQLLFGHAVTLGSWGGFGSDGIIVRCHAYSLRSVETIDGVMYATVYNPWSVDGVNYDSNPADGLLRITMSELQSAFAEACVSLVASAPRQEQPLPIPMIIIDDRFVNSRITQSVYPLWAYYRMFGQNRFFGRFGDVYNNPGLL